LTAHSTFCPQGFICVDEIGVTHYNLLLLIFPQFFTDPRLEGKPYDGLDKKRGWKASERSQASEKSQ